MTEIQSMVFLCHMARILLPRPISRSASLTANRASVHSLGNDSGLEIQEEASDLSVDEHRPEMLVPPSFTFRSLLISPKSTGGLRTLDELNDLLSFGT
jgi:hypothetical protein